MHIKDDDLRADFDLELGFSLFNIFDVLVDNFLDLNAHVEVVVVVLLREDDALENLLRLEVLVVDVFEAKFYVLQGEEIVLHGAFEFADEVEVEAEIVLEAALNADNVLEPNVSNEPEMHGGVVNELFGDGHQEAHELLDLFVIENVVFGLLA